MKCICSKKADRILVLYYPQHQGGKYEKPICDKCYAKFVNGGIFTVSWRTKKLV